MYIICQFHTTEDITYFTQTNEQNMKMSITKIIVPMYVNTNGAKQPVLRYYIDSPFLSVLIQLADGHHTYTAHPRG